MSNNGEFAKILGEAIVLGWGLAFITFAAMMIGLGCYLLLVRFGLLPKPRTTTWGGPR